MLSRIEPFPFRFAATTAASPSPIAKPPLLATPSAGCLFLFSLPLKGERKGRPADAAGTSQKKPKNRRKDARHPGRCSVPFRRVPHCSMRGGTAQTPIKYPLNTAQKSTFP
jgi:hypothetical protein